MRSIRVMCTAVALLALGLPDARADRDTQGKGFIDAISKCDAREASRLLKKRHSGADESLELLLMRAVVSGCRQIVNILIAQPTLDPNKAVQYEGSPHRTPLFAAIERCDAAIVGALWTSPRVDRVKAREIDGTGAARKTQRAFEFGRAKCGENFFPKVALANPDLVSIDFRGFRAPHALAATYDRLYSTFRALVNGKPQQTEVEFWKTMTSSGAWPSELSQPASMVGVFAKKRGSERQFAIPQILVTSFPSSAIVAVPNIPADAQSVPPKVAASICQDYRWRGERDDGCIIQLLPRTKNTVSTARDVLIRYPAYRVTFRRPGPDRLAALETSLRRDLAQRGLNDVTVSVDALRPARHLAEGPERIEVSCVDGSKALKDRINLLRRSINWPATYDRKIAQSRLVVIDDYLTGFPPRIYDSDEEGAFPSDVVRRLHHPYLYSQGKPRPYKLTCSDFSADPPDPEKTPMEHAAAVASTVYGTLTSVSYPPDSVELAGFYEPTPVGYAAPRLLRGGDLQEKVVLLAAYEETATKSAAKPDSIASFHGIARQIIGTNTPIIIAAPRVKPSGPSSFGDFQEIKTEVWGRGKRACVDFPACLGASPFGLVVAALDKQGTALLRAEPSTKRPYLYGSDVIAVAAPGEQIPTATVDASGHARFTFRSATSLAAPVVAAIALSLQEHGFSGDGIRLIARIASTADLSQNHDGLIRFGRVNAARAFLGNFGAQSGATATRLTDDAGEQQDANVQRQSYAAVRGAKVGTCAGPHARHESLPYFLEGESQADQRYVKCLPVERILRIRRMRNTEDDQAVFAVVFWDRAFSAQGSDILFPNILRDVVFRSRDGQYRCRPRSDMSADGDAQPCLIGQKKADGAFEAIDLTSNDIIFHQPGS